MNRDRGRQRTRAHSIFIKACVTEFSVYTHSSFTCCCIFISLSFVFHSPCSLFCTQFAASSFLIDVKHPKKNDVMSQNDTQMKCLDFFSFQKEWAIFLCFNAPRVWVCMCASAKFNATNTVCIATHGMRRHCEIRYFIHTIIKETKFTYTLFVYYLTLISVLQQQQRHPNMKRDLEIFFRNFRWLLCHNLSQIFLQLIWFKFITPNCSGVLWNLNNTSSNSSHNNNNKSDI